jgi:hypothetical protein
MPENTLGSAEALRSLGTSLGYYVDSMAGLLQHRGETSGQVFLRGYYKAGDGAEGFFVWRQSSVEKDNGGTVIDPSNGRAAGRWIRISRAQPVTPLWWGARFDDQADDTDAIQAAIDFAVSTGGDVLLPPGTAKITRTLMLTTGGRRNHSGFSFSGRGKFGDSGHSMRDGSGTLLKFYGAIDTAEAILTVDRSLWSFTTVGNLSLQCVTPFTCKFGVLFSSTEFSQHRVDNVTVHNTKVAFGILKGTGGNGEFVLFSNCGAHEVGTFFYNNSGQAFTQRFDHCTCGLLPDGTYFVLDVTAGISPGGGLIVTDFNATGGNAGDPLPPTNTTLLYTGESTSPVSFYGGRVEHLSRLLELGQNFIGLTISIRSMDLTVDCDPALPKNRVGSFITARNNPAVVSIADCQIDGVRGREFLGIDVTRCGDSGPAITFSNCILNGFVGAPRVLGLRYDTMTSIKFVDCRQTAFFAKPLRGGHFTSSRKEPLNYRWGAAEADESVRSRTLSSRSALAVSGRPANLLVSPAICRLDAPAAAVSAPDAPWVAIGNQHGIAIALGNRGDLNIRNASAWSRTITLPPGAGLAQDIAGIDLAAEAGIARYYNEPVHEIYYQALFRSISGRGSLRVALENNITDEVYDEAVLQPGNGKASGPNLVSLLARVPPLAQSSGFRLKLQNIGPTDALTVNLAWQFASPKLDASFVGIDGVAELKDDWSLSAESLRAWGRFMLPYKADAFGSAAVNPLKDLYSDQYMSADDGRLTYFAGDVWCKAPRTQYGGGPPQHGSWRVGDQMLNHTPKAGSYVGWICTTAGSPGEWRPFGLIA